MSSHTFTPTLAPDVLDRLHAYAGRFRRLFPRSEQLQDGQISLKGLLLHGEQKPIEPLSHRAHGGNEQCL